MCGGTWGVHVLLLLSLSLFSISVKKFSKTISQD